MYCVEKTQIKADTSTGSATSMTAPFQVTGVDLAGPLYLQGEAFLRTFRRFIARRGRSSIMKSDNGTNFTGTKNLLRDIDWDEAQRQSTIQRIEWKLNVLTAAWWGGFFERLIKYSKVGDIVLIETEDKRIKWPLGLVVETITGNDGINRTAKVRTSAGYKTRPFQRLYRLEIFSSEVEGESDDKSNYENDIGKKFRIVINPSSISTNMSRAEVQESACKKETTDKKISRTGRIIKMPSKYNI
ncbi:unnamed protein product [Euphydryas editha]|uniref:DUF5641 domain-containing protein n=1 Tax=Euphydryas editha TaxID=104508 RepID=A0AAU9TYI5_EUPED|nr:unnamed protein product [Euphydryas editha]